MRQLLASLFPLSLLLTSACAHKQPLTTAVTKSGAASQVLTSKGATNFSSQEGGFAVYFPVKPVPRHRTSNGKRESRYTCRIGSVTYAVDASPISPETDMTSFTDPVKRKKGFDYIQAGILKQMDGKLETSREVVLNGVPGRQYTASVQTPKGVVLYTMHIYASSKFSYLLMAMGLKKNFQTRRPQIEKFFNSFRPV